MKEKLYLDTSIPSAFYDTSKPLRQLITQNLNPIRKVHEINLKNNYKIIEIGSLLLFGGDKYGNI